MATDPLTDAILARQLLERAVAWNTAPALTEAEVDSLLALAGSLDVDLLTVYTGADLNRAASLGWQWKAAKVAAEFNVSLPEGMRFERNQQYANFMDLAAKYATGELSVLGTDHLGQRRYGGITTIGLVSTLGDDGIVS